MLEVLAQTSVTDVCGPRAEAERLCVLVYELTGSEPLARAMGVGSTIVWVVVVLGLAVAATQVTKLLVLRYASRLEQRILRRLDEAQRRGELSDTRRFRTRRTQRLQAAAGVVRGVFGVVIWITALLLILDLLGVPLQPLLAGAGLAGIVLGFGAQQLVRDVLAGIAMLIEDQYGIGDWIEVDGRIGVVERMGLRSTAFRDVDGVLHHVLNGYIQRVGNLSQEWARATLDVPVALDTDVAAAKALLHQVAIDLAADPLWGEDVIGPPEVWGVQDYGPAGIRIRVVIPTKPLRNWELTRQLRERLKEAFDAAGIRMPGQLVDLGGQGDGYPLLTGSAATDRRVSERPAEEAATGGEQDAEAETEDPTVPMTGAARRAQAADRPEDTPPDATTLLRRHQGPRPRPD